MRVQEIYTIVLLSLLGLGLLRRSLQQLYTLVCRPLSQIILRYLVYTQVFRPGHLIGLNPTWAETLALAAHWAATAACNAYRVRSLPEASARAGQLALVHLIPLISVRQLSFASHVLGWSLRTYHFIHGSLGIMATAQGIIHAVIALQERTILGRDRIVGIICFVAVVLLAVLPLMRRFAYEWFLHSHLALSVILAVCLWEHVRLKKYFNRPLMLGATGAFLLTSGVRYAHQVYQNIAWNRSGPQMIRVVRTERLGSSLVLELKLSRAWAIVPGQHVYLTILTWREFSVLQRHPFMITWWQSIPGGSAACSISVVIRQNRGWTRRIQNHDGAWPGRRAWLRGPYGASVRLEEFGTVIMFASGDGIFAQLPFIRFLTDRSKLAAIKTRRIKLVWQTDEYHDRLRQWMQSIMDDEDVEFDLLDISIHVSQNAVQISGEAGPAGPVTKVKRMGQRLKVIHDVPDVESYIQLEMKEPRRQVAVSVSGHRRLREEVRLQVFRTRRLNVRLFESDFQPVTAYRDRGGTAA